MSDAAIAAGRPSALWRRRRDIAAAGASPVPLVAILCTPARARVAGAGVALALARVAGAPCALAGVVGDGAGAALGGAPAAGRAAARLRERGLPATAGGRLVWLADRRGPLPADDVASRAAATSAELRRAAAAVGAPAAVALPFARVPALDRVLAWHDAIVVVREPDAPSGMLERALASLVALGRPVAAMAPPPWLAAALAVGGLRAPAEAVDAIARLGLRPAGADGA